MAGSVTAVADATEAFVWKFPGAPIRVYVNYGVVERLATDVSSGSDRAGLLFGRQTATAAIVQDYQAIQGESLSKWLDKAKARGIKKACGREHDPLEVIGAYRIEGGDRIVLSSEDRGLMAKFFPGQQDVFLKVRKDMDSGPATAGFFFWDGVEMFGDFCLLEFPMDVPFLKADAAQRREPGALAPSAGSKPAVAALPPASHPQGRLLPALAVSAVLIAGASTGAWFWWNRTAAPQTTSETAIVTKRISQTPSTLGFQAEARATDLHIKWDRTAAIIQNARIGVLSITDGEAKREVPLTADQLRSGSVTYTPVSPSIELRLEVFSEDGRRMSEDALAIWIRTPNRPAPVTVARAPEPQEETTASRSASARPFVFQSRTSARSQALPEPPPVISSSPAPGIPSAVRGAVSLPPTPQPAAPQVVAPQNAPAATPTRQPDVVNPPAPSAQKDIKPLPVTPARPLRRVPPVLPSNVRAMLRGDTEVSVKVLVDAKGNVVQAEVVTPSDGFPRVLVPPALSAARQWRFEPARTENGPLPSEFVLKFRFSRNP